MINCPTCEFADFENNKCTRLLKHLPHICPYAVEKKPRNHFELLKAMSMEKMAIALCRGGCPPTVWSKDGFLDCSKPDEEVCEEVCGECWLNWLKEEIKND